MAFSAINWVKSKLSDLSQSDGSGVLGKARWFARFSQLTPLLKEPFVHFLILGSLIFGLSEVIEHYHTQYRVVIGQDNITRISESYRQQYGALPSEAQLKVLVSNYVKEEVLYREAVALGLDKGDEIVRRRLVQKFTFLQQDLNSVKAPSEEALYAFYKDHTINYTVANTRHFSQVYFSPDIDSDQGARQRAQTVLAHLRLKNPDRAAALGDPFVGNNDVAELDKEAASRVFGNTEISSAIFTAPLGQWVGPYKSGYGWHLVKVTSESKPEILPFLQVKERVLKDYQDANREKLNDEDYQNVLKKYNVVIESHKS